MHKHLSRQTFPFHTLQSNESLTVHKQVFEADKANIESNFSKHYIDFLIVVCFKFSWKTLKTNMQNLTKKNKKSSQYLP
ncbi:CLUMA_CG013717, isoform A [Clunio marinus]|uniref:CLUMA_CG013717, isoform A n=1 Tax=Clunio marinus TaxID=568069 RepID=A0A1J1IMY9_9DIPT|nr:CLUMA_CG013717, isoform A [Clunio marinus]